LKIAVSANGPGLDAQVDPRFGRAPYFLLVDPDTLEFEVLVNLPGLQAAQGAGVQAGALVAGKKPAAVLTGHCGPKAFDTLQAAGIPVIVGVDGPVREAVQNFQAGKFKPTPGPNVGGHWR
jgi:predicted Fe-Mo cluster-binding NifX family protein